MTSTSSMTGSAVRWPGFLLGFSLGGFFDGILLHQILQWHHLLSNVDAVRDMRGQIMADGLFHALMYFIAAFALYTLWKRRMAVDQAGASRSLWGTALVGFGAWHILDSVVSHWITGIHRIKVDSPNPLMWDLIWFVAFGVIPLVLGWSMQRRASGGSSKHGRHAATSLGIAALVAGALAGLPAGSSDQVMVLFAAGVTPAAAFNALARVDARVVWVDGSGGLWAVRMKDRGDAWQLYRSGAILVSNSAIAIGCFSWSKAA